MYNENDLMNMTPRERINEELSQRRDDMVYPPRTNTQRNCRGSDNDYRSEERLTWGLENHPLASVYSPIQIWRNLYEPDEALKKGTLFKELDLPFERIDRSGGGCCGK